MSQPYKSGRQQNLNLGITSVTENRTVLQTIGKVGIGTTNAQNHSLFVVGTTNITGDINVGGASTFVGVGTFRNNLYVANQLYVGGVNVSGGASIGEDITTRNFLASGISTFNGIIDANSDLDVAKQTTLNNLNVTGIATIQNLNVQSGFDVYDTTATFHNNVFIAGNLSIGGTATNIIAQDLRVFDKEITLGITTDAFGNDISNDITANHGGISIASTVGSPLVDLGLAGFSTLPATYKQLMWVAANSYGVGTTDAWMFNYAVGIGSTLIPNGVYLAAGAIQATKDTLITPNLNAVNANVTGVSTLGIASATTLFVTGVSTFKNNVNLADNASLYLGDGNDLRIFHNGANSFIQDNGTGNLFIDASNTYYRAGTHFIQNSSSSETLAVFTSNGSVALYYDNVKTFETSGIGATVYGTLNTTQLNATGIVTGSSFRPSTGYYQSANGTNAFYVYDGTGNVAFQGTIGVGQINSGQGYQAINLSSDTKPTVTFIDNGIFNGVVTARQFVGDINAGIATLGIVTASQLYVSGVSTLSTLHAPKLSYNGADFGGSGYLVKADGTGGWTWADVPGIFSVNNILNGFNVQEEGLIVGTAGSITTLDFRGVNITATADPQPNGIATIRLSETPTFLTLNVSGISTLAGITTVSGSTLFTKQLNVSGVSTFAGIGTFTNDLYVGGNLYIQNDLVFDEATLRNINITGLSTLGVATASQLYVSGVTTTGSLTVTGTSLFQGGVQANSVIFANGGVTGNLTGNVTSTGSNSFGQATVTGVVTARQFIGDIQAGVATITQGNIVNANGSTLNYTGLSTITDINSSGIVASGIVTARQFVGDINAGVATITQGNIVNANGSTLNYTGLSTITDISASGIRVTGVITARQFVGDINAGVGTITSLNSTSANLTNINSTGISTLNIISANQINLNNVNVTGVVTARQFIGDVQAGIATITQGNITSASGTDINYTGISTLGSVTANQLNVIGVVTARQFVGDVQAGIATITQGNITNANGATLNYTGLSTITDINASGITVGVATITTISGTNAVFIGNVSIGGTLTYEDVTNVDSIGVITARSDVRVGGNLSVVGVTTLASAGGITTTGGDLYVGDDIFFKGNLYQNGQLFASGIGIGSTSVNPGSGVINTINNRIGVGFTDINIVGTGISVTGYGSTVVIDFGNIAAASGGALSISTVFTPRVQDVSFVGGASTSIIGISTFTDRFVYDTQTGSVGIGTSASSIPSYKLDVMGDINSSTSVKIKGVDVLEEAVRLAIAFG